MNTLVPYFLSAVSPVTMQVLYHKASGIKKRTLWLSAFIITILANSAAFIASLLFGGHVTEYEFLFVSVLASVGMTMLLFPLVTGAKVDHIQVLKMCCIVCICSAVYSILTYGQANIHGDIATASMLTKAQLKYGSFFPRNWCYVNGDIWTISMQTFVTPFSILLKNQSLARMLGSALFVLLSTYVIIHHSKHAFHDDSWVISIPVLLIFLYCARDMILYQAAYTGHLIYPLTCVYLLFHLPESRKRSHRVLFTTLIAVLVIDGVRYVAELALPLWLTVFVFDYLRIRTQNTIPWKLILKKWLRTTCYIIIPTLVGCALHLWISSRGIMINTEQNTLRLVDSISDILDNIRIYIINLIYCFGFNGSKMITSLNGVHSIVCILMCLIFIFAVPILQAIKIKKEDAYTQFFFTFTVIHNLIIFVLAVFFVGKNLYHYLLTSIFLTVFLSARYIYKYWICQIHFDKYLWTALFVVALVVGNLVLVLQSVCWKDNLTSKKELTQQLVNLGLTKGYGDFWIVYPNEVYSDFKLQFGAIETDGDTLYPHRWLVDNEVFQPEETRTFLLLTEDDHAKVAIIANQFQKPEEYYDMGYYHVYIFGYDIAADLT